MVQVVPPNDTEASVADDRCLPAFQRPPVPMTEFAGTFHLMLIGVDLYETEALKSLNGCVNDIDAVEALFMEPPGCGCPPERVRVTRLVSTDLPRGARGGPHVSERGATREDILAGLSELVDAVRPEDRVHVHYSGHGGQYRWKDARGSATGLWSEGLLTSDGAWVTDVELNHWIGALADMTDHVTVVLDCCHASGATRGWTDSSPDVATRGGGSGIPAPGADGLVLPPDRTPDPGGFHGRILGPDPRYVLLAACQSHEEAQEKIVADGARRGLLTHSLVRSLARVDSAGGRRDLRWADLWPDLLETAASAAREQPTVPPQQPWLIGRPERRVFGGAWKPQDLGFAIRIDGDGRFRVRAGTLMGVTPGTELGVYASKPDRFPSLGSDEDLAARVGTVSVVSAERTLALCAPLEPFELPEGARARVVRPLPAERLRVRMEPHDGALAADLERSDFLRVLGPEEADHELLVTGDAEKGWTIADEVDPRVARVPAGLGDALRAGLEHYARYNQVLRLATSCVDLELQGSLSIRFLEVRDETEALGLVGPAYEAWLDALPELPKENGVYSIRDATGFVASARNASGHKLRVFLFDCAAGGQAYYLRDLELRAGERGVFWWGGQQGQALFAEPTGHGARTVDRFVAVGTTSAKAELASMGTEHSVQEVVDAASRRSRDARGVRLRKPVSNPELWTATVVPLVISTS